MPSNTALVTPLPKRRWPLRPLHLLVVAGLLGLLLPPGWLSAKSWEWGIRWVYISLLAFLLASLLTPFCVTLAFRLGVLDMPNARKIHSAPIPRLGGLALFLAVVFTTGRHFHFSRELTGLILTGGLIFFTGVVDDAKGLSARLRLTVQLAAAVGLVWSGVRVTFLPAMPGEIFLESVISVIWVLGITNAINFLDGVDGLATGMGALCALLFLSIAWPTRQGPVYVFTAALGGACLGFLPHNWRPARIFLGDGGSTFIGFTLAALAIMGTWAENSAIEALATPLLILGIPIYDMTYTTISRVRNNQVHNVKEWLEFTGKDHFHHRLMHLGLSAPQAVGFILLVNLILGMAAITIRYTSSGMGALLLLLQAFFIFLVITILMLLGRQLTKS